jgi:hypothetical protein
MITADAGGGAKLVVNDGSCTVPAIAQANGGSGERAFLTAGFDGTNGMPADAEASRGIARTREGYVEIIEMGDMDNEYILTGGLHFLSAVYPLIPKCSAIEAEWGIADPFPDHGHGTAQATADIRGLYATSGGLAGTGTLINVAQGTDYSYDPVALAGFYMDRPPLHTPVGSAAPSLADAAPVSTVTVVDPDTGIPTRKSDDWTDPAAGTLAGIDAVSATLMRSAVINEYVVNTEIHAGTDWVITFPTKRWYVDQVDNPVRPFSTVFSAGGACEPGEIAIFDQSGQLYGPGVWNPVPRRFDSPCWAANVVSINNGMVLASALGSGGNSQIWPNINVGTRRAGRMSMSFPSSVGDHTFHWAKARTPAATADLPPRQLVNGAAPNHTHHGLPVIGFAVQRYVNDVLPGGVLSNYGGAYAHRYERKVTP